MMPMTIPGPSALNPESVGMNCCSSGRDEQKREVPVDHRRNACKHLEQRLHHPAQPRRRVFTQIDCRKQAGGERDDHRDRRHQSGAGDKRKHAEVLFGKQRRPLGAGQKLDYRHFPQKCERLEQQHRDDAAGDENRDGRAQEQCALDDELDHPTLPVVHFTWPVNLCSRVILRIGVGCRIEHRAGLPGGESLAHQPLLRIGQRHVSHLFDQGRARLEIELHKPLEPRDGTVPQCRRR